ncbi:hypothetical protein [Ruminococcus sp.]|uniref:hypothetical protein n=1 Tax=Ruminococcus sp. TaxID=41978 RepID=UPI0025D58682|nr:hypothetical protein [Ruminococcus sp.]MBQ8966589.1 hypothetical protein [Ruminococcus sp.]
MDLRKELDEIVKSYDLVERTVECFWANYDSYLDEEPEESHEFGFTDRNSARAEFYGYYYGVSSNLDFEHIKVCVDGYRHGENCRAISFWCIYRMDGELFDDHFVVEQKGLI